MTEREELVDMLTREGDHKSAALFAAMTDEEFAARVERMRPIADAIINDPLMMLEMETELKEVKKDAEVLRRIERSRDDPA